MKNSVVVSLYLASVFVVPWTAHAQDTEAEAEAQAEIQYNLKDLSERLDKQQKVIEQQQRMLDMQAEEIAKQRRQMEAGNPPQKSGPFLVPPKAQPLPEVLSQAPAMTPPAPRPIPKPVVAKPEIPQIQAIANEGGILTPKGKLMFENTIEYTNTTRNLFTFNGVELAQVVLVGQISANDVRRQIVQETGRLRLGITDRLEADVHVPFVYRNDATTTSATIAGTQRSTIEAADLGDIDAGLAYQLNRGRDGWPYLIGNVRYKANNADGPFDVNYDSNNLATRAPTGTGFQTVEASVTAIKVSDPAVLFGNIGYVYDVPRNIDRTFNNTRVGRVEPGDAINALAGIAFSINPDVSFSIGYKHSYVFSTVQHSRDVTSGASFETSSGASQVGTLILGLSYALKPTTSLNFTIEAGLTHDAPDVHLVLRMPFEVADLF